MDDHGRISVSGKNLTWVSLPYATFGIISCDGIVTDVAPIAGWTIGKTLEFVLNYYRNKGAQIEK